MFQWRWRESLRGLRRVRAALRASACQRSAKVTPVSGIPAQIASDPRLDAGESEALAVALSIQADAVLLDELAGRDCAASLGIQTIGTLGLLVRAKNDGHIPLVAPLLRRLLVEASFRASPALVRATLQRAGELS